MELFIGQKQRKNKVKFSVYDSGKPAKYPEHNVHPSWKNNSFDTFDEAIEYMHRWLGRQSPGLDYLRKHITERIGTELGYCYGYPGDIMTIKQDEE